MSRIIRRLTPYFPFVLFTVLILVIFLPVFTAPAGYTLFGDDFFRSYGFFRQFFHDSIRRGIVPWWNPYLFSGSPFMANPSVSSLYPVNFLYALLPVARAWTLITVFEVCAGSAGMYWLGRKVLGLSRAAGVGMAVIFGLSGPVVTRIWAGHTEILASIPYIPWVFGLFLNTIRKHNLRSAAMTGSVFGVQIIAGYQTVAMFTGELLAVTACIFAVTERSLRPVRLLVTVAVIGAGLSAVQLLPGLEYFRHSIRTYSFGYDWAAYGSVKWENFRELVSPFALGGKLTYHGTPPNYPEQAMYAGAVSLLLAVTGLFGLFRLKGEKRRFLAAAAMAAALAAVFAAWVALGPNAPVNLHRLLWDVVPLYRNLRIPPRHLILLSFGISVLAGFGIETVKNQAFRIAAVAVIVAELLPFARQFIEIQPVPGSQHDKQLIAMLSKDTRPERLLQNFGVWVEPRDALDFDAVMPYRIYSATGYDPSILRDYYDFADAAIGAGTPSVREHDVQIPYLNIWSPYTDFLNIKYILVPAGYDPIAGDREGRFRLLKTDEGYGYRLYENLTVLPRFFLVPAMQILPSRSDVYNRIRSGTDLSSVVLASTADHPFMAGEKPDCAAGTPFPAVTVSSYGLNDVRLDVHTPCSAFLSSSEVMYPGWTAYVDGNKTDIIEGNLAFRTLYLSKGVHTVDMVYVPYSYVAGVVISLIFSFVTVFMYYRKHKI